MTANDTAGVTASGPVIRVASRHEHDAVVRLLADAFVDEPLVREAVRRASFPAAARRRIFELSLRSAIRQGGVLLVAVGESSIVGAGIITVPRSGWARTAAHRVIDGLQFVRLLPALGRPGLAILNDTDLAVRPFAPRAPHHVLVAVGVSATARGTGAGRALVDATFDLAANDRRSHGVRLEAASSENAERYSRWGFESLGRVDVAPVTVHIMYRAAPHEREGRRDGRHRA